MKKSILAAMMAAIILSLSGSKASAHVTVKPNTVGVGAYQTYTVSVPVEKETPTTQVKLIVPQGVESVMPNVKPGWTISIKKNGEGDASQVSEIVWSGGSIPKDQRDEFLFSAKAPVKTGKLVWKAYQTYKDGTVVAWDAEEKEEHESGDESKETSGPASITTVIDDLAATPSPMTPVVAGTSRKAKVAIIAAVAMSAAALVIALQKRTP